MPVSWAHLEVGREGNVMLGCFYHSNKGETEPINRCVGGFSRFQGCRVSYCPRPPRTGRPGSPDSCPRSRQPRGHQQASDEGCLRKRPESGPLPRPRQQDHGILWMESTLGPPGTSFLGISSGSLSGGTSLSPFALQPRQED